MRRQRERRARVGLFDVLDGIELVLYSLAGFVLLLFVVFLGIRSADRIAGPVASGAAVAAAVAAVALIIRDAIRRHWSAVSIGAAMAYALCLMAVIAIDAFVD